MIACSPSCVMCLWEMPRSFGSCVLGPPHGPRCVRTQMQVMSRRRNTFPQVPTGRLFLWKPSWPLSCPFLGFLRHGKHESICWCLIAYCKSGARIVIFGHLSGFSGFVFQQLGGHFPFRQPPGDSGKTRVEDMQMLYNQLTHARHPPGLLLVTSSSGQNATQDGNVGARNLGNLSIWCLGHGYHHINKT